VEILLLHPGSLGDIILSLPAIALLRKQFPSAAVTIAGNVDHLSPIVSGYAERMLSFSALPLHHLYTREALPPGEVLFWKSFSRIVSWTGAEDPGFVKKLQAIHPDACVADWKPRPQEPRHVSQLFALSFGFGSLPEKKLEPAYIRLDPEVRHLALQWLAQRGWDEKHSLTALHLGAGSKEKRWPLSRFLSLARKLVFQEKRKLLLIEGPAEKGLARHIEQQLPSSEAILAESLHLSLLAAVIEQCGIFVGNDSGIAHLAAALKVPCVVLFGPTLPRHWAPLGEKVVVLRNPDGCEGCASGSVSGCRKHTCLDNITVEEVLRNLNFRFRN
jgi:ADP-heptose:LPS heptosyltransferase